MKYNIINLYTALLLLLLLFGCKQAEIDVYDQSPRIDFINSATEQYVFTDTTYLKNITELDFATYVHLVGAAHDTDLNYSLVLIRDSVANNHAAVTLYNPYKLPANEYMAETKIRVSRPETFDTPHTLYLGFDKYNGNSHQFEKGRVENMYKKISVTYKIHPGNWDDYIFGIYSNGKYKFIMDVMQKTYREIDRNSNTRTLLYNAYEEYLQENDSIMDDGNPRKGIVFPLF